MKPLMINLLITLLAIGVCYGASVGAQNVFDQIAQETSVSRAAVQTVEPPKLVTAKPESPIKNGDKAKLRKVHYVPPHILKQQHLNMLHNKMKKNHLNKKSLHHIKTPHTKPHQHMHTRPQPMYMPVHTPLHGAGHTVNHVAGHAAGHAHPTQNKPYAATAPRPVVVLGKPTMYSIPDPSRPTSPALISVSTTTTTTTTTTPRPKRVKRIWPKDMINNTIVKYNTSVVNETSNGTASNVTTFSNATTVALEVVAAASNRIRQFVSSNAMKTIATTTTQSPKKAYTIHTRKPRPQATTQPTTALPTNLQTDLNDWIPMVPRNYPRTRRGPPLARRTASSSIIAPPNELTRRATHLQTYGLYPLHKVGHNFRLGTPAIFYPKKKKRLNSNLYSGFSGGLLHSNDLFDGLSDVGELQPAESRHILTKIKHHHHHHHHKYVKTVEKPVKVPFKVEVHKPYVVEKKVPYPVEKIVHKIIEKKVPVPYTIEKKVPYPVEVKVPQPYPVKVIEKQYISKPYPVIHKVPVIKHVEKKVPYPVHVTVEKKVPYPVEVKVPVTVEKHIAVPVEKKVSVPYPVKVYVPHPVPVEKRVPFPVEVKVKEPYPVIKHIQVPVPVKVFVDKPYPVKVAHPYPVTVEKRVPYPVEVEKRIPVPVKVYLPHPVPVEKPVPVYVHEHAHAHAHAHLPPAPNHEVTVHGNGHFQGFPEGSHSLPH